ncbi:ATP-dependent DNA helicase RecG [bacterium D16-76]|nr:ATP-dependent DNA helicase RecG [bacterium D16-76]
MPPLFEREIESLKGVGPKRGALYRKLGAPTVGALLRLYPRAYEDWGSRTSIGEAALNEAATIQGQVLQKPTETRVRGGKTLYKAIVTDGESDLHLTFFNNRYIPMLLRPGQVYLFRGRVTGSFLKKEMLSPEFVPQGKEKAIVPVYPATQGLTSRMVCAAMEHALALLPKEVQDPLPAPLREKYGLVGLAEALRGIHFPQSPEELAKAKARLVFEEFLVLQLGLMQIKGGRRQENPHPVPGAFPEGFASLLPFPLTGAQRRTIAEAIGDMAGPSPMNRLVQGDVGSGKTAVAAALCWAVAKQGYQAALMAPTEILAAQHFQSLSALLAPAGIRCALFTGSMPAARRREQQAQLAQGEISLAIGTHALISGGTVFQDLALVITDEQHRFGVNQRSALAGKGTAPHLLVMSATPIPRTLALMVYGDLDISVLDELPPGRQEVSTYLIDSPKRQRAFGYIQKHLDAGRQGYLVCPLVEDDPDLPLMSLEKYREVVARAFPGTPAAILHGKMKNAEKEQAMSAFASGAVRLLLATTVIEVGVDVPNAAIMLIENAERYGLSQLHQLRGRIGRGPYKSTCILLTDAQNEDTLARLRLFRDTRDGFKIADADLKLRGPGDFFGARQHGLPQLKIADMANDMDILRRAQLCAQRLSPHLDEPVYEPLCAEIRRLFATGDQVVL